MRAFFALIAAFSLSACAGGGQFAHHSLWPFGNPNAPIQNSDMAQRALGKPTDAPPMLPQPGDVWPGPVQPMPTLSEVEKNSTLPLGQGYTPSLPSPYPPGQGPADNGTGAITAGGNLYNTQNGEPAAVPAVPGDAR